MPGMPRPHDDETTLLLAFVAQQRDLMATAAHGLTDEQARATPTTSSFSVGGLVKHVTAMERSWMDTVLGRTRPDAGGTYQDDFEGDWGGDDVGTIPGSHTRERDHASAICPWDAATDRWGCPSPPPLGVALFVPRPPNQSAIRPW